MEGGASSVGHMHPFIHLCVQVVEERGREESGRHVGRVRTRAEGGQWAVGEQQQRPDTARQRADPRVVIIMMSMHVTQG